MSAIRKHISLLLLFLAGGLFPVPGWAQMLNEDTLKANYIIGFVDFVHWERKNNNPITIGIVGSSALENEITTIASKKQKSGASRKFKIQVIKESDSELAALDVIYFPESSRGLWSIMIPRAQTLGILTVGDSAGFLDAGGLIEFVIRKNRLRFSLNLEASDSYSIGFSSKLAQLAVKK